MKTFSFKKIDAFTDGTSSGNPAGAIYLEDQESISDNEMLAIAKEVKSYINEVGYIFPAEETNFQLRYFSSEREVDFCGHATIAIMYDMITHSPEIRKRKELTIQTNKGISKVYNRVDEGKGVLISAPLPEFQSPKISVESIAKDLDIPTTFFHKKLPVQLVNGGLWTLIVPLKDLKSTLTITPHFDRLKRLCKEIGADIITIFSDETINEVNSFRSRVFPPTFGYVEDPATGSGNAALGYYLQKHGKWNGKPITIEQNSSLSEPNILHLCFEDGRVLFGGKALTRISGEYILS